MPDKRQPAGMARARQELEAARVLVERGFPLQAVSRAYYAAFHAAEQALFVLGETRSSHSGVISAFGALVVRAGGFEEAIARVLPTLFNARNRADYGASTLAREDAEEAISDAERFVDAVESWLEARST